MEYYERNLVKEKSLREVIYKSLKMANLPSYKFQTLGCFYEKDTKTCLNEEPHQNKPYNQNSKFV